MVGPQLQPGRFLAANAATLTATEKLYAQSLLVSGGVTATLWLAAALRVFWLAQCWPQSD
ncbi:MAG: hypothetical protein RRB13_16135 [bacterium]|nr:hypothetical protein [bacterium]